MSIVFYILTSAVHAVICYIMYFLCIAFTFKEWNKYPSLIQHIPGMITGFCLLEMLMIKSSAAEKVIRVCYDFLRDPFGRKRATDGILLKAANGKSRS